MTYARSLLERITAARFDFGDASCRRDVFQLADIVALSPSVTSEFSNFRSDVACKVVERFAESKKLTQTITKELTVGVVFGMWGESNRLRPKSPDNPKGEDCLRAKVECLNWLLGETPIKWHIYAVDDGCPNKSGQVARDVISDNPFANQVSIAYLADKLPSEQTPLKFIESIADSVKGGAIVLGGMMALADKCSHVCFTDCDNSVLLGQLGSLLYPACANDKRAVFGDRWLPESEFQRDPRRAVYIPGVRILLHLKMLLLDPKDWFGDVPSPFKLFEANLLEIVLNDMRRFDFAFDYDMTFSIFKKGIAPLSVPYLFLDSYDDSAWHTFGSAAVWLQILHGYIASLRLHRIPHRNDVASEIDKISTVEQLEYLMSLPAPPQLVDADAALGSDQQMSLQEIQQWFQAVRAYEPH
ncbi:hypothetical protein [Consotaella aegiceratis]|uniref:hypothetical protein n=1 Tax=Consotaella aegiceratis TaxID=3097961 RepID=UPI002F3F945E